MPKKIIKQAEKAKESQSRIRLFQEAFRVYDAALKLSRSGENLVGTARCLVELGRKQEARELVEEALKVQPAYKPALVLKKKLV